MPTYVYECAKCGEELEAWQSFSDKPLTKHSGCGGKLSKVLQPVGIVFKGSGFHRTDSRSGGKRSRDGSTDSKDKESKADSTSSSGDTSSSNGSGKSEKSEKADTKKSDAKTASGSKSSSG
jgi:putative FmdB family regulatory protein